MRTWYPRAAGILSVVVGFCAVIVDVVTPIDLNVSVLYSLPLVIAGLSRSRRLLWGLLLALLCVTFAVYDVQIGHPRSVVAEALIDNRVLTAMTMVLTAALVHVWTRALDALDERDRRLGEQNARLLDYQRELNEQKDAMDRRRQDAEAESARKTMLFASVSHDVRTPLAAINLTAQAIGRSVSNAELAARIPAMTQRILVNSASVEQLISDILDFSTFELGHVELHPSDFSVGELVGQQCQILLPLAEAKKLALTAAPIPEPVWIHADRAKLGRVLANLMMNAIKYTETGSVWVGAGLNDGGGIWIRVRDSGAGIAADDLPRIFDDFARLRGHECARSHGWGLGLSICHRMVALMGGAINVDSSPNIGSTFTVTLPPACVLQSAQAPPAADAQAH